jgi:hypothetical protein
MDFHEIAIKNFEDFLNIVLKRFLINFKEQNKEKTDLKIEEIFQKIEDFLSRKNHILQFNRKDFI